MKEFLRTSWLVACKDLSAYCRDRAGVALGFLLPAALITIFGYVMKFAYGGEGGMGAAELWYADEDQSERSKALVAALRASDTVRLRPLAGDPALSAEQVRQKIEDGEEHHGLVIRAGFGAALEAGELPSLTMFRDPGREMEDMMLSIGLSAAFMEVTEGRLLPAQFGRQARSWGMPEELVGGLIASAEATRAVFERFAALDAQEEPGGAGAAGAADQDAFAFNPQDMMTNLVPLERVDIAPPARPKQLSYMQAQSVSGIAVMMLMFGLVACGAALLREREEGTLPRLLIYARSRNGILAGKFLFTAIMGLVQLAVLFVMGELLFRVGTFRDPLTLMVLMVTTTASVTAFGMLIAAWARTQKQAEGVSTLIILVMSAVGGAWFPVQIMNLPAFMETATRCTLTHWAVSGFQGMFWYQQGWSDGPLLTSIAVQWAFTLVAGLLALYLYRRNYLQQ